jgi:hypothetical protein
MSFTTRFFDLRTDAQGQRYQHCKQPGCIARFSWKKGVHNGSGSLKRHYESQHPLLLHRWKNETTDHTSGSTAEDEMVSLSSSSHVASDSPPPVKRVAAAAAASDSDGSLKRRRLLQTTLQPYASSTAPETAVKLMALAFATNHIAYNVANSATFRAFLGAISPITMPDRRGLKAAVSSVADETRTQLWSRLRSSPAPVAIAIDGWTNVRQTKVTNVVLISGGVAYYWCSIPNPLDKNSAQWLHDEIAPKLQELLEGGVRFAGFVADNEAVNGALFDKLAEKFPWLVRLPCAAHTIQLVVKLVMQCTRWAKVQKTVDDILRGFATSKQWRQRLLQLQQGEKAVYVLVKPNDTRWNSHLYASQRLFRLKAFIDILCPQDAAFWAELQAYIEFLEPFQVATDTVQKDSSTLFHVWQQWNLLSAHIQSTQDQKVQREALSALRRRWKLQVNTAAAVACALLSLDTNLDGVEDEIVEQARLFILRFGCAYMRGFKLSALVDAVLEGKLLTQLGQFTDRRDRFQQLGEQIFSTKQSADAAEVVWNPLNVWAMYQMELAIVARALLSLPASEAAVERTFSAQGAVHTKLRNRLHDRSVQQEMFVAFNHRALSGVPIASETTPVVELRVEFLDTDTESDSDEELEEAEHEPEHPSDEEVDLSFTSAAAAAAPAAAHRTQSAINADNRAFLLQYIVDNGICPSTRWSADRMSHLEAAALGHNSGGYSTQQLIRQVRELLPVENP